ncbi:hypothetical protein HYU89_00410 [Candidatus Collierbacteria bacterium]|nr:hypothetical protein [Candidatus Collierbacteria bacterium]
MKIKPTRNQICIAKLISRVFDPVWLIPGMLATAAGWSLINDLRWRFIVILLLIDGLIPFIYFVHLLSTKEISDWDTTKREQRVKLYGFTLVAHSIGAILALLLGKIVLAKILFLFLILAAVFTLITFRWKISIHTGVSAATVIFLTLISSSQWLWSFLIVALIAWARIVMKKHTFWQVIIGAGLAAGIVALGFYLLEINSESAINSSRICILGKWC